jgi:N-acetylglucosamine kinase-like BadF-type ATPase
MFNRKKEDIMLSRIFLSAVFLSSILSQTVIADNLKVPNAKYILCIDGGGSKTALQVVNSQGKIIPLQGTKGAVQEVYSSGSNIASLGWDLVQLHLEELLKQVRFVSTDKSLLDKASFAVVAGFAGVGTLQTRQQISELFKKWGIHPDKIVVTTDIEIAQNLLNEKEGGAVLIAGTGSIAFIKNQGRQQRVGGLGWYLGDEGSGFFVGKKAIAATVAEEKGFGKKTALTPALKAHFQQQEMVCLISFLQNGTISAAQVAAISPIVFDYAYSKKDPIARFIVKLAAQELANLICCGLEITEKGVKPLDPNWPVYLIGGQFKGAYAQEWIKEFWYFLPQKERIALHNLAESNTTTVVVQQKLASLVVKSGG